MTNLANERLPLTNKNVFKALVQIPVLVAALGYLVDMYDLFLFSIVRRPSLEALGFRGDDLLSNGVYLLNVQLAGLLLGGLFWGILADKKGRLSVLFGSIIIYSLATFANGFVTSFNQYVVLRFIAGIGLAGELGVGITLVAETLPKEIRGYGTTLVATMGVLGVILAYFITEIFDWRTSYYIGGGLGILLLFLRFKVFESGMFINIKTKNVQRGNVFMLFNNWKRFTKYFKCILVGTPIWFVVGILVTFSPEFGKALGVNEPVVAGKAVMFAFLGQVFGDIVSGLLSQRLKSRKKAIGFFIILSLVLVLLYLLFPTNQLVIFYVVCGFLGFANGYWTLFITIAAELFGTNLRATVATTAPNFVRGFTIIMTAAFLQLKPQLGIIYSALAVGIATFAIALICLWWLDETFSKDLNYVEDNSK